MKLSASYNIWLIVGVRQQSAQNISQIRHFEMGGVDGWFYKKKSFLKI